MRGRLAFRPSSVFVSTTPGESREVFKSGANFSNCLHILMLGVKFELNQCWRSLRSLLNDIHPESDSLRVIVAVRLGLDAGVIDSPELQRLELQSGLF